MGPVVARRGQCFPHHPHQLGVCAGIEAQHTEDSFNLLFPEGEFLKPAPPPPEEWWLLIGWWVPAGGIDWHT